MNDTVPEIHSVELSVPVRRSVAALFCRPTYGPDTSLRSLPFASEAGLWDLEPPADYGDACLQGRAFGAHFAAYMCARPEMVGSNTLGLLVEQMGRADPGDALGYRVGFFAYLEHLIHFAAAQVDTWGWMEAMNRAQVTVERERGVRA